MMQGVMVMLMMVVVVWIVRLMVGGDDDISFGRKVVVKLKIVLTAIMMIFSCGDCEACEAGCGGRSESW